MILTVLRVALKLSLLDSPLKPSNEGTVRAGCFFLLAFISHLTKIGAGVSRKAKGHNHSIMAEYT